MFATLALLVIARRSGEWLAGSGFALVAAMCTVVALWTRRVCPDTLAAIVLVLMAAIFMWMNLKGPGG